MMQWYSGDHSALRSRNPQNIGRLLLRQLGQRSSLSDFMSLRCIITIGGNLDQCDVFLVLHLDSKQDRMGYSREQARKMEARRSDGMRRSNRDKAVN